MRMENSSIPYVGMVIVQAAQVGLMIAGKVGMSNGMTPFTFTFYSNALSSLLLLPPLSFHVYRSARPPLLLTFLCGFFLLGFIGFLVQILGYAGISYASASLSTAMLNLIPGFTFIFAVVFRMEKFEHKSSSTAAKCIGTTVLIVGALILTLYQGPPIFGTTSTGADSPAVINSPSWLIGGLLLAADCMVSSLFIILQALVLKKCPAELVLMFFYSCFIAIVSALVSLTVERDVNAWTLKPKMRLLPVIYSALFGNAFQVSVIMWCIRRKGPFFASMFHPLGVIFANAIGIVLLGDTLYLGSLVGSVVVVVGFYAVMWGKRKEAKRSENEGNGIKNLESNGGRIRLLQNSLEDKSSFVYE